MLTPTKCLKFAIADAVIDTWLSRCVVDDAVDELHVVGDAHVDDS